MPNASDLVTLFERCFFSEFHTVLQGGADEPFYEPGLQGQPNRIFFTKDYFASALHEVAHWCVAGDARRNLPDYGYWYAPDGRDAQQQAEFERMEIKPQALEWLFSAACGVPFRVSADNLNSGLGASREFKINIASQAQTYCENLPRRPARFIQALSDYYRRGDILRAHFYSADVLL